MTPCPVGFALAIDLKAKILYQLLLVHNLLVKNFKNCDFLFIKRLGLDVGTPEFTRRLKTQIGFLGVRAKTHHPTVPHNIWPHF